MQGTGQDGRITASDVRRAIAAGKQGRVRIRDGSVGGLILLAGKRGATWEVEFKPPGRNRDGKRYGSKYLKIGDVRAVSPEDARRAVVQVKDAVLHGRDPRAERRAAQERAAAPSWAELRSDYVAYLLRRLPNPRSRQNEIGYIARVFNILDARAPLRSFGLPDTYHLIDNLPPEGVLCRQCLGAFGRLHDWARGRELIDTPNPARLLPRGARPRKPDPRRRALSLNELACLWRCAGALVSLECNLLRLMISLPLRKGEVSALEWGWLDRTAGLVTVPGKKMKGGEDHSLPLGTMARRVLDAIADGAWPTTGRVFKTSNAHVADWGRFKSRVDTLVPLPAWVFHDLRRSFVSALAEHGHAEPVLDMMLAHRASSTRSGVLGVYQVSRRLPEQRAAMAAWDGLLAAAIDGQVVQLRA
jgi:integrase